MSQNNESVIIVTARRVDGPGPGWRFTATVHTYSANNESGSGGGPISTQTIGSQAALEAAISALDANDRVIIQVPGMPPVVIDGKPANDFFQSSFTLISTLMVAMADGRIEAILPTLDRSVRAFIQDLKDDFETAEAANRFIRITNVDNLPNAIQQIDPEANLDSDDTAAAIVIPLADTGDWDRDPSTTQMHQLFFDSSKADRLGDPRAGSRIPTANGLTIQLLHEMFHFLEGDASARAEMQRMVQLTGRGSADSFERHDRAYDAAASVLNNLLRGMKQDLAFDPITVQNNTVRGTDGSDQFYLANPMDWATFITTEAGDDAVTTPLGNFTLATGEGNDVLNALQGSGWLAWIDEGGSDRLDLTTVSGIGSLAVELVEGWVYIGGQPKSANQAAGDVDSGVYFRPGSGPDSVTLGGSTFSLAEILDLANSRPSMILPSYNPVLEAPFYGGYVGYYGGHDYDNDPVTLSVVAVQGVGAGSAWWFDGPYLYTSARYQQQWTEISFITIRVSDGSLSRDYVAAIEWRPNPYDGPEYMPPADDLGIVPLHLSDVEMLPTLDSFSPWMP